MANLWGEREQSLQREGIRLRETVENEELKREKGYREQEEKKKKKLKNNT